MFNDFKKVVFFGAHTDDEMICAGTLHRLVNLGAEVWVVTFGPAATEGDRHGGMASLSVVKQEWHNALDAIGVSPGRRILLETLMPTVNMADHGQVMCQTMYDFCEFEKPDAAFILSPHDENPAHAVLGVQAERVMRGRVDHVIRCQFPWNYPNFRPNLYVTLSQDNMWAKQQVIDAYKSQHFRYNYGEMLPAYTKADGLSVKWEYAEKFEIVRSVV